MKVHLLVSLGVLIFLMADAAIIRLPTISPKLLGGLGRPFMKRGILKSLCCFSGGRESYDGDKDISEALISTHPTYINVAKHLHSNPNEYNTTYQYILTYLKEIVRYSDGIIDVLEDYKAFNESAAEENGVIIADAIDIWTESSSVLTTMKPKDWDSLFERADPDEAVKLEENRKKASERVKYLKFLIWFYAPEFPYEISENATFESEQ
ncbi:hypothetical protein JCM33374_g4451 [Metschnikowia sp. JCM 33374]|nr:hypothetical protein JCM33374_g4451 [Metschnikowia sp. JCM 33374]